MQTSMPVRVVRCTNAGELSPVGYVDIVPLVNQISAQNESTPHGTIFNVPYCRIQGGTDAVIIDPKEGDIGIACFASRDISRIKATKDAGNPGSGRTYSFADAQYIGGVLNGVPTQYVQFSAAGIKIHSPTKVIVEAPECDVTASVIANVTAPSVNLGSSAAAFLALVTSAFMTLFNNHTHPVSGGTAQPTTTPMGASHMTSATKGN